ncbi:hypothetical protein [Mesoterricola sediminis]|uniref:Uncharacterized protein n=1 Tax=Mesoterricola sediminis TaxID=2927980 RepID=A0AA48GVN1_9BACT|nr:hypothetical protein [Mesoterricola sediminis]BDU78462.1 hypothetical protein METESE_34200 [Mesoterricola sediminis]
MLHPHVPDSVRGFTKHLFATFLGLLMALGLESCAEHGRERRMTRAFLERVHAELVRNLETDREMAVSMQACQTADEEALRQVQAALDARKRGLPPPRITAKSRRRDVIFSTSAWSAAKASGMLRNVPPALLQELASVYDALELCQELDRRHLSAGPMDTLWARFSDDWNTLPDAELEGLLRGIAYTRGVSANWKRAFEGFAPDLEKAARSVEAAL